MRRVDIQEGCIFGRLTAICSTTMRRAGSVVWECRCSCGGIMFATASKLQAGNVNSCGCLRKEKGGRLGQVYGRVNLFKRSLASGTQTKHRKAGGTNRAKSLLKRLAGGLLLLLLSCGLVEAQQDIYTDCIHKAPDGKTYDICRMPDMRKILDVQASPKATEPNPKMWYGDPQLGVMFTSPCEQKMKEAMKAVDGYLPNREVLTGSTLEYCDDVCAAERALDATKKQAVAMAKWRAVYKECVK